MDFWEETTASKHGTICTLAVTHYPFEFRLGELTIFKKRSACSQGEPYPFVVYEWTKTAVRQDERSAAKTTKNVAARKAERRRKRIRMCPREVRPDFSKVRIAVTTGESGMIVIESLLYITTEVRFANEIAEVVQDRQFWMFVKILSQTQRCLPKHMVVEMESKIP